MRRAVLTLVLLASTVSLTSAAEGGRRAAFKERQAAPVVSIAAPAPVLTEQATPAVSDIPIIPMPASLRPKRPPAGSPL
jgi:hypothetical protein